MHDQATSLTLPYSSFHLLEEPQKTGKSIVGRNTTKAEYVCPYCLHSLYIYVPSEIERINSAEHIAAILKRSYLSRDLGLQQRIP